jgi:hypothetical protein
MPMRELSERDIDITLEVLRTEILKKMSSVRSDRDGYPLGGELITLLVYQVAIPLLVSLLSAGVYDALKARIHAHMTIRESQDAARQLVGKPMSPHVADLSVETLETVRIELEPIGFTADEIISLHDQVKARLSCGDAPGAEQMPDRSPDR